MAGRQHKYLTCNAAGGASSDNILMAALCTSPLFLSHSPSYTSVNFPRPDTINKRTVVRRVYQLLEQTVIKLSIFTMYTVYIFICVDMDVQVDLYKK